MSICVCFRPQEPLGTAPGEGLWEGGQLPSLTPLSDRLALHTQHAFVFRTPSRTGRH